MFPGCCTDGPLNVQGQVCNVCKTIHEYRSCNGWSFSSESSLPKPDLEDFGYCPDEEDGEYEGSDYYDPDGEYEDHLAGAEATVAEWVVRHAKADAGTSLTGQDFIDLLTGPAQEGESLSTLFSSQLRVSAPGFAPAFMQSYVSQFVEVGNPFGAHPCR